MKDGVLTVVRMNKLLADGTSSFLQRANSPFITDIAKVDELMALHNRKWASITATAATRRRLLDAMLAEALAPADEVEREAAE